MSDIKELTLPGDIASFLKSGKEQVSKAKNQGAEKLKAVGLTAYYMDDDTLQIHEARLWTSGFDPKRIIPDVDTVTGIGLCWDVLVRTMAALTQLMSDRAIPHTFHTRYLNFSEQEGDEGIHLIILVSCKEKSTQEELKELSNDLQEAVKKNIDELLQDPHMIDEDKELIEQISKTILVIVEGEGEYGEDQNQHN